MFRNFNDLGAIHTICDNNIATLRAFQDEYPDALLNLANLYQDTKRWEEAVAQLQRIISINSHDCNVLNQLALIYLEIDDTVKALRVLKKSLELKEKLV